MGGGSKYAHWRAISKLPFELGIGPICSWCASESENKRRHFWP